MQKKQTKVDSFEVCLAVIAIGYLAGVLAFGIRTHSYYLTPVAERAFHPLHSQLKPSGTTGHTLGSVGGVMMLLTFLYPIRKRWPLLQRFGTQKHWLSTHILFGLGGPGLVVIHTTGKLNGLAAIGFYSMMAMVFSGIFGRYLYSRIPRNRRGKEMSLAQIEEQLSELVGSLEVDGDRNQFLAAIEDYLSQVRRESRGLIGTLFTSLVDDLMGPWRVVQAWRLSAVQAGGLTKRVRATRLILKQRRLLKKLALLEASQSLFSYWHIFHRPFTFLASSLIAVHVAVATYLGYGVSW